MKKTSKPRTGTTRAISYAEKSGGLLRGILRQHFIVKPLKEGIEKTAEKIKQTVKKVFAPTKEGLKVARVRRGRIGLVMTFVDESSWQTVVGSQKLKDRGLKANTLSKRLLRIAVYGVDRTIEKEELIKVVHAQNHKAVDFSKF